MLDLDAEALAACRRDVLKVQASVARPEDCGVAVAHVLANCGGLDVLINNAGIGMDTIREDHFARPVRLAEIEPEHWRRMFEVNCMGAFLIGLLREFSIPEPGHRGDAVLRAIHYRLCHFWNCS